jgi:hypothetical protein
VGMFVDESSVVSMLLFWHVYPVVTMFMKKFAWIDLTKGV